VRSGQASILSEAERAGCTAGSSSTGKSVNQTTPPPYADDATSDDRLAREADEEGDCDERCEPSFSSTCWVDRRCMWRGREGGDSVFWEWCEWSEDCALDKGHWR
jgi:hypothetical protein